MTKVASAGPLPPSNSLYFGAEGVGVSKISTAVMKRKTPSELRGELLKRKNSEELVDESPAPSISSMRDANVAPSGSKKPDLSKAPRFTRMNEHYPVTKASRLLSRKENPKETVSSMSLFSLKNPSPLMDLNGKRPVQHLCPEDAVASQASSGCSNQADNTNEKYSNNTFKSVRELSVGGEKLNGSCSVDMGKALKGLVFCEPATATASLHEINRTGNVMQQRFDSKIHVPGDQIPLDLTLKTTLRLLSSSSVTWFHRLVNCGTSNGIAPTTHVGFPSGSTTCLSEPSPANQIIDSWTLNSWVHPQSTLPRAAISALASVPGGQTDFLTKRQQSWEDSFSSLYYMLRKRACKIFYVCTDLFIVMFVASDGAKETKSSCQAYVSQSTRNLRALMKEQDVSFSMPLCRSKVEEVTAEDLVELSEIEKHNLGQTRVAVDSMAAVDNSPQSLLMISGNKNVHALYDFLLNYRSVLSSLTGSDVPVLYSSVPFENAALSRPEVRCKQVRRVSNVSSQLKESDILSESIEGSSSSISFSVEVRDSYIPPWTVSAICNVLRSKGSDFQASFVTESTSIGLNVGLDVSRDEQAQQATAGENSCSFGIPNTTLFLQRRSAYLKGLKYNEGSHTAFLSPIE